MIGNKHIYKELNTKAIQLFKEVVQVHLGALEIMESVDNWGLKGHGHPILIFLLCNSPLGLILRMPNLCIYL